jgi:hypothetical protein
MSVTVVTVVTPEPQAAVQQMKPRQIPEPQISSAVCPVPATQAAPAATFATQAPAAQYSPAPHPLEEVQGTGGVGFTELHAATNRIRRPPTRRLTLIMRRRRSEELGTRLDAPANNHWQMPNRIC